MLTKEKIEEIKKRKEETILDKIVNRSPFVRGRRLGDKNKGDKLRKTCIVLKDNMFEYDLLEEIDSEKLKLTNHEEIIKKIQIDNPDITAVEIATTIIAFWKRFMKILLIGNVISIDNLCKLHLKIPVKENHNLILNIISTSKNIKQYNKIKLREKCIELFGLNFLDKISNPSDYYEQSELEKIKRQ